MIYPELWVSESTQWPQICCRSPIGLVSKALLVRLLPDKQPKLLKSIWQSDNAYATADVQTVSVNVVSLATGRVLGALSCRVRGVAGLPLPAPGSRACHSLAGPCA